ncbi:alpha-glucosidase [Lactobacillus sp. CC-MHH1034]|uniref:glycoside hydrolase family 13 protein n=1 Tax=Agrilactobacillus fermenti TaxID=2586909 RepID=UPI001E5F747F|nr:alpha-glucosidase [Agrilactobacillus fermenti]MCD2256904.1 alpha-glucosidase [Agrilactobacillus fermenti]
MNKKIKWWQKSVVYQVYPKSFNDSNGDGIGDIPGIQQKLPYLKKLGVDVIWLNPIYQSPQVDNGYDISNYRAVDPELGTMAEFESLLTAAHTQGLKIILDLVVNHTSDQHPWFKAAEQSKSDPHHDYYIWKDPVDGHEPNNWGSSFGGSTWTYNQALGQYYLHLFAKQQPDLNWENPKVRQEVYDLMRFWLDKGIDGFRMDVISLISKDPKYPDGPVIQNKKYGSYYAGAANGPKVHEYLHEMYQQVLRKYDIMTVGETPHTNADEAVLYTKASRQELNMVFHFDHMHLDYGKYGKFSDNRFKLPDLKAVLSRWQTKMYDHDGWNSLYWSNHDQARPVTRFGNDGPFREKSAKMLGVVLHMLQGTPYIYQGEEIGMTNADFKHIEDYQDIETHNIYHEFKQKGLADDFIMRSIYLKSRDNARTPMPWNAHQNAGFTTGQPWLKLNPNYTAVNVAKALADQQSVFYFYQRLIALRHQYAVITTGKYDLLNPDDPNIYAYTRSGDQQTLLVVANFSAQPQTYQIPAKLSFKDSKQLLSNETSPKQIEQQQIALGAYGAVIYLLN